MASEKSVMAVIRASRPSFRNNNDKAAFAVHASFLASGYILVATGPPAFSDNALSDTSSDEVGIDHWNELDDDYAFVYVNPEKGSKKVLVKCLVMNGKLLVDALAEGGPEPVHMQINVGNYVEQNQGTNYSAHYKNLEKLVKNIYAEIFSKLYGPRPSDKPSSSNTREGPDILEDPVSQPYTSGSETREGPRYILEDPVPKPYTSGIAYPPVPVNPIGGSDLFPGPGAGMFPTRDNFGIGGGMLLGPNDPRWFGWEGGQPGFPGRPAGVPPGARFDPYNPPGIPGFEPNRINRYPGRPGGGTHPDLEHFGGGSDFI